MQQLTSTLSKTDREALAHKTRMEAEAFLAKNKRSTQYNAGSLGEMEADDIQGIITKVTKGVDWCKSTTSVLYSKKV
ncbi:hypothetical protein OAF54_01670 [bacterium]|nr:hypothetical protein [bacterium]